MAMVKVLQERVVRREDCERLLECLLDLRGEALTQPGYVTGETLFKGTDPVSVLVIATWVSQDHWEGWKTSEVRNALSDLVAPLLIEEPTSSVYRMEMDAE